MLVCLSSLPAWLLLLVPMTAAFSAIKFGLLLAFVMPKAKLETLPPPEHLSCWHLPGKSIQACLLRLLPIPLLTTVFVRMMAIWVAFLLVMVSLVCALPSFYCLDEVIARHRPCRISAVHNSILSGE